MVSEQGKKQKQMLQDLALKYKIDERHAYIVEKAALKIFDCMASILNPSFFERDILSQAALLHDIGYFIKSKKHHLHSKYIIDNDELLSEYPAADRKLLSLVIFNHRKKIHKDISLLTKKERELVINLSAILRVADSLDYTREVMKIKSVHLENSELKITIEGGLPERISGRLMQKKTLFCETFKLDVVLNS